MLTAIKQLGSWRRNMEKEEEILTLIKTPFEDGTVILIKIDLDAESYGGVELEDYDPAKLGKYLYRKIGANGPNCSPSSKITEPEKTFKVKILAFFKKYAQKSSDPIIKKTGSVLEKQKDQIIADIEKCIKDYSVKVKKRKYLLTLKIRNQNNWRYVGDFPVFRSLFIESVKSATRKAKANDKQLCCLCGERKAVTGDPRIFSFYTIDKPGFIAGGFEKRTAWKNFPVCDDCKLDLEAGRKFIEQHLTYRFSNLDYWLIPSFIIGTPESRQAVMEILISESKSVTLENREERSHTENEREILDLLKEMKGQQDVMTVNLLFLKVGKDTNEERILLLIEDVFPSRIRTIYDAKDKVDAIFNRNFTFRTIRTFFRKSTEGKQKNDLDKYFLTITECVLKNWSIDLRFLLKFLMLKIRREFIQEVYFRETVIDALMTVLFLSVLSLLTFQEVKNMNNNSFDSIFSRYRPVFEHPAKKGVFLLGALTQLLLNKQYAVRNATPFRKYLKGLKMDEKDFKALLPKVENKLEEYESFDKGKRSIAAEVSRYLLEAGDNWGIPSDELNFCFACGMNLHEDIASIVYSNKDTKEE